MESSNEWTSKRHGAAALQDAGATDCMQLIPRGFGVRQPYAAFVVLPLSLVGLLVGCARFHSKPLSASANADALENRSLTNAMLKTLLETNLHREFGNWPVVEWDFDMLTFAGFYYHPSLEVARV